MHPFGPPELGVRMTVESGPGCSVSPGGRVAGSCGFASAPGLAFSGGGSSWLRIWKLRAGSRRAIATVAMLLAAAVGQLGVGVGKRRALLGRLGGLLQDPAHPRGSLLGDVAVADLRSELRTAGVNPAQAHSLRAEGNRAMSPISATRVMAAKCFPGVHAA
jgi:hypothetical protein